MKNSCLFWMPLTLLSVIACTGDTLFHQYLSTGEGGWNRGDTLDFTLPESPSTRELTADIGIRHTRHYPYQSIWVVMERKFLKPDFTHRDTLEIQIADKNGMYLGRGNSIIQQERTALRFTMQKGQYGTLRLYHIMIRETVPDIRDVGIRISVPSASVPHQFSERKTEVR